MTHVKDSSYFSHDSNARRDPKILALRSVYGMQGYGWYWTVIEMFREQPGFKIQIDNKYCYKAIAMELECDEEQAREFIHSCIEGFGLFSTDGDYFWSDSFLRRMQIKEEKSNKARQAAQARWDSKDIAETETSKRNANAMQTQSEKISSNASKVKESKVKESKAKESTKTYAHPGKPGVCGYPHDFDEFWNAYPKQRRTERKAAYRTWKARINAGANPEQLIAAARNYAQEVQGKEPRYVKLAKTFLGPDTPYEDYLEPRAGPGYTHEHGSDDLREAIARKTVIFGGEDSDEW